MKKLKALVANMQGMASLYLQPPIYQAQTPPQGEPVVDGNLSDHNVSAANFIGDMLYMLDGPEQREAQAEASFDYLELSSRTASGEFYGQHVNDTTFRTALLNFAAAAAELDRVKKLLFYGEDKAKGRVRDVPELGDYNAHYSLGALAAGARVDDNEELSWGSPAFERAIALIHGVLGVATEGGEMVEALLAGIEGKGFDGVNMIEEIGDVQWYEAMLARALGTDFDAIQRGNIDKLIERFKHKFSEAEANNRNLAAERVVLDGIRKVEHAGGVADEIAQDVEPDDVYPMKADTFDAEETAAAAQLALSRAEPRTARVHTQLSDFPDEAFPGPDPQDGKYSG